MTKLRLILRLIRAKKYLLMVDDGLDNTIDTNYVGNRYLIINDDDNGKKQIHTSYSPHELTTSGNAIYIKPTATNFTEPTMN